MKYRKMIRVGRRHYSKDRNSYIDPEYPDFKKIIVMTASSGKYSSLSPYIIKNSRGQIMENLWQFSKVYQEVPRSIQRYSRYDSTVIWQHPAEVHVNEHNELTDEYFAWRVKGFNNPYAVRYPVGYHHRHKCLCAFKRLEDGFLDYVESRKQIYLPVYTKLVSREEHFHELKELINIGQNLLLIEVDGPHQESMDWYQNQYGVDESFIQNDTMLANKTNLEIMLNDTKHPFGHGYCLAAALLDLELE